MSRIVTSFLALALTAGLHAAAQTAPPTTNPAMTPQAAPSTAPTPSQQQPSMASPADQPSAQDEARDRLERLGTTLNLTADQKTKLQPILAGEIQKVRELRSNTSMTPEQKQAEFQQTLTSDHAKVQAILTPEQQQKLADLKQKTQAPPSQSAPESQAAPQATPPPQPK